MLRKRNLPPLVPQARKRRKTAYTVEEIKFDPSAREDYLTGFHKRKLQRIKHAKEEAAKKERQERIEARRVLRDGRKSDLEKHIQAVNSMVAKAHGFNIEEEKEAVLDRWAGIGDAEEVQVDHEQEYVDEDRFTTVTVETVDVSRDGLYKVIPEEEEEDSENPDGLGVGDKTAAAKEAGKGQNGKPRRNKEQYSGVKKKKKKFRYETKAERKITTRKEKLGKRAKADARKK